MFKRRNTAQDPSRTRRLHSRDREGDHPETGGTRVRVTPAQVYNLKSTTVMPKLNGSESLILAKKLADALGGVEPARAALDVLAKLL